MACEEYSVVTNIYEGRDNPVSIVPYSDIVARVPYDMTDVTLVEVWADLVTSTTPGDAVTASSDDAPATVTWTETSDGYWRIDMIVGMFVGIVPGEYTLRVVITEPDFPNGIVVADDLRVNVIGAP